MDDCSNASLKGQPDEIRRCEKLSKSFGLCLIINYKRILHISSNLLESRDFTVYCSTVKTGTSIANVGLCPIRTRDC